MKYEGNRKERIWEIKLLGIDRNVRIYLPTDDKCTVSQHPAHTAINSLLCRVTSAVPLKQGRDM